MSEDSSGVSSSANNAADGAESASGIKKVAGAAKQGVNPQGSSGEAVSMSGATSNDMVSRGVKAVENTKNRHQQIQQNTAEKDAAAGVQTGSQQRAAAMKSLKPNGVSDYSDGGHNEALTQRKSLTEGMRDKARDEIGTNLEAAKQAAIFAGESTPAGEGLTQARAGLNAADQAKNRVGSEGKIGGKARDQLEGVMDQSVPATSGAGGNGSSAAGAAERKKDSELKSGTKTVGAVGATGASLAAGAWLAQMLAFLLWLRMLFYQAIAALANLLGKVLGFVYALAKTAAHGLAVVGHGIATAVGFAASTAASVATGAAVVGTTAAVAVGSVVSAVNPWDNAKKDDGLLDCGPVVRAAVDDNAEDSTGGPDSKTQEEHAKSVYGVLAGMGMPDENIAGILGNWSHESGIDPTSMETILNEPYSIGSKKKAAIKADYDISQVDAAYSARFPAIKRMGIGFGQWTNDRNQLLVDYAKKQKKDWWEVEVQLGFMFTDDARPDFMKSFLKEKESSPEAATEKFMTDWEGLPASEGSNGARKEASKKWFAKMGGWDKDEGSANSILDQAGSAQDTASDDAVGGAEDKCRTSDEASAEGAGNIDVGSGEWSFPLPGGKEMSPYGKRSINGIDAANGGMHWGSDIGTGVQQTGADGGKLIAPTEIKIVELYPTDGCLFAVQTSDPGYGFGFCHMNKFDVKEGDVKKRGDVLGIEGGKAGNLGGSVVTHLHYEMYKPGANMSQWYSHKENVNPKEIMEKKGAWIGSEKKEGEEKK